MAHHIFLIALAFNKVEMNITFFICSKSSYSMGIHDPIIPPDRIFYMFISFKFNLLFVQKKNKDVPISFVKLKTNAAHAISRRFATKHP